MKIQKQEVFLLTNKGAEDVGKKTANFFFHSPPFALEKRSLNYALITENGPVDMKPTRKPLINEKFLHFMNKLAPKSDSGILNTPLSSNQLFPIIRNPRLASQDDQKNNRPLLGGGTFHQMSEPQKRGSEEFSFLVQVNSSANLQDEDRQKPLVQESQTTKHKREACQNYVFAANEPTPSSEKLVQPSPINRGQCRKSIKRPPYIPWKVHSEESEDPRSLLKSRGKILNLYPEFLPGPMARPDSNLGTQILRASRDKSGPSNLAAFSSQQHHIKQGYTSSNPRLITRLQNESTGSVKKGRRQLSNEMWKPPQAIDRQAPFKSFNALKQRPEVIDQETVQQSEGNLELFDSKTVTKALVKTDKVRHPSIKRAYQGQVVYKNQSSSSSHVENRNRRRSNLKLFQVLSQLPSLPTA